MDNNLNVSYIRYDIISKLPQKPPVKLTFIYPDTGHMLGIRNLAGKMPLSFRLGMARHNGPAMTKTLVGVCNHLPSQMILENTLVIHFPSSAHLPSGHLQIHIYTRDTDLIAVES